MSAAELVITNRFFKLTLTLTLINRIFLILECNMLLFAAHVRIYRLSVFFFMTD